MGSGDKPKSPAKPLWAPPSLSIRVKCAKADKLPHPLYGLFVILRMATPGPGHPSLDKVIAVHDGVADKPADAYDVYLRLHLLSHCLVAPHGLNADGFFGLQIGRAHV